MQRGSKYCVLLNLEIPMVHRLWLMGEIGEVIEVTEVTEATKATDSRMEARRDGDEAAEGRRQTRRDGTADPVPSVCNV